MTSGSRLRRTDVVALLSALTLVLVFTVSSRPGARADTSANPDPVTRAKIGSGNDPAAAIAPPGPLTGITDGTVVHIHTDAAGGQVFGLEVRLCRAGLSIEDVSGFRPTQSGDCIAAPFGANDDAQVKVATPPPNASADLDFRVGKGTQSFQWDLGQDVPPTATITCDENNPCALWVDHSVPAAASPDGSGHVWKHFDVSFGTGTAATTTTSSSIPTSNSSSTTSTTSTSTPTGSSSTTSTTASPSSSSTTSTTAPGDATSVSPSSLAAGASVTVSSPGWKATADVTATLHSDPVVLGQLTADSTGKVSGSLVVPAATPAGSHTLELTGAGADGSARSVSASLTVTADPSGGGTPGGGSNGSSASPSGSGLVRTGMDVIGWTIAGGLLVLAGVALVRAARRRALGR